MLRCRPTLAWLLGVAVALGWGAPALGWTPECQAVIARQAARLAPPDLYRQIVRNREAYLLGTREPFRRREAADVTKNADGSGRLDAVIERKIEEAVRAIELHRPFNEVSYRLGVVAHYLAAANDPLNVSDADPTEARYADDYRRYLASAEPRFQVVFYGFRPRFQEPRDVERMLGETLARSRSLYPFLGREYRRIGFGSGIGGFDDRSTAFGVGAIAFSHAVSDIAQVLRYIWLRSGGVDSRQQLPIRGQKRIVIPR